MKLYLILAGVFGAAVAQAQTSPAAAVKPVATTAATGSRQALAAKDSAPRHLSSEERAELRRQLYEYSRLSAKDRDDRRPPGERLQSQAYAKE